MGVNVVTRYLLRVVVLVIAVVVAAIGVAQDSTSTRAGPTTQIFLSYSEFVPQYAPSIILNPGGTARDVYVWVVDVTDPSGVSGYNLELYFDGAGFVMSSFVGDTTWLNSTGRAGACAPPAIIEPPLPAPGEHAFLNCVTIGQAPPFGATGSGILATITLRPGGVLGSPTILDFSASENGGTFLLNTPGNPDDCFPIQPSCFVPATVLNSTVLFMNCADNSGDGTVDLANDILGVILRYQMTESDPAWDPAFDVNVDGTIDLSNDILGTILQYQLDCVQDL